MTSEAKSVPNKTRQCVLKSVPTTAQPSTDNFEFKDVELPSELANNQVCSVCLLQLCNSFLQVLVQNLFISVDPYVVSTQCF